MSKKRTKADQLQRSVDRLERRDEARIEFGMSEQHPEAAHSTEREVQIRQRAYELYEARGRQDGHDLDDWLQAEAEIHINKDRATAA